MKKMSILIVIAFILFNCQKEAELEVKPKEEEQIPTLDIRYSGSYNQLNEGVLLDTVSKIASIIVETNQKNWDFKTEINDKLPNSEKWLTLTKNGNTLEIEAEDNYTDIDRRDVITISTANGVHYVTKKIVQYSYDPPLRSFIPDIYFREKVRLAEVGLFTIESRRQARIFVSGLFIEQYNANDRHIKSLAGIDALLNLQRFVCKNSNLKVVNLPNSGKLSVSLSNNHLLEHIDLTSLDALPNLGISNNEMIDSLELGDLTSLTGLSITQNNISELDLSSNRKLVNLNVCEVGLREIDVSKNIKLESFRFGGMIDVFDSVVFKSSINEINLTENSELKYLYFNHTAIKTLNLSNNYNIERIECNDNLLEKIDLSRSEKLKSLNCSNNKLKILDVSNSPDLLELDCTGNPIEIVYVNKGFDVSKPLPTYKIPPEAIFKVKE